MTVDFGMHDKVAIVTGGSKGIGRAIARYATGQTFVVDGGELILGPADRN